MKKILFLGACVASLAIASSSAFAAVTYGQDDTLTITNPAANSTDPVTSISVDASGFGTTGQMTVLVLDGTDSTNITADKILYIDQDDAGTNIFQNMGLKLPEGETKLADGSYKIMVGNDQGAQLLTATLTIAANTDPDYDTITFYYGDINNDEATNAVDASAILNAQAGATNKPGKALYALGTKLAFEDGTVFYYGDVNNDGATNAVDASAILNAQAGATNKPGKAQYALGTKLENVKVKVVTD